MDIDSIEKLLRRATRIIPEIYNLSHDDRLYKYGILSLVMRRLRSDLILIFEIVKGFVKVEAETFFQFFEDSRKKK